jgi:hypothetical protein
MPALLDAKRTLLARNPALARKIESSIEGCCAKLASTTKALNARGVFLPQSNALRARTMCRLELRTALSPASLSLAEPVGVIMDRAVPPRAALRCVEALANDLATRADAESCDASGSVAIAKASGTGSNGLPSDRTLRGGAATMAAKVAGKAGAVAECMVRPRAHSRCTAPAAESLLAASCGKLQQRQAERLAAYRQGVVRVLACRNAVAGTGVGTAPASSDGLEATDVLALLRAGLQATSQPSACVEDTERCTLLVRS